MARLYSKYIVRRLRSVKEYPKATLVGNSVDVSRVGSPFVLMPSKDPAAMIALKCYADNCETELAEDIKHWIERIEKADKVLGTQGRRNQPFVK